MELEIIEARLRTLESSQFGFLRLLEAVVVCTGSLATYIRDGDNGDPESLDAVLDGLNELRQALARLREFLPPEDE